MLATSWSARRWRRSFNEIGDWSEGITPTQCLEWCKRRRVNGYVVWNSHLIAKNDVAEEGRDHNLPALCMQVIGGHAYMMKTAKSFSQLSVCEVQPTCSRKLAQNARTSKCTCECTCCACDPPCKNKCQKCTCPCLGMCKDPVFGDGWRPWLEFTLEAGIYHTEDALQGLRDEFVRHSFVPKLSMKNFLDIRRFTVTTESGSVTVHQMPTH